MKLRCQIYAVLSKKDAENRFINSMISFPYFHQLQLNGIWNLGHRGHSWWKKFSMTKEVLGFANHLDYRLVQDVDSETSTSFSLIQFNGLEESSFQFMNQFLSDSQSFYKLFLQSIFYWNMVFQESQFSRSLICEQAGPI